MGERLERFLADVAYLRHVPRVGPFWESGVVDPETVGCLENLGCLWAIPVAGIIFLRREIDSGIEKLRAKLE